MTMTIIKHPLTAWTLAAVLLAGCSGSDDALTAEARGGDPIVLGVKEVLTPVTRADQQRGSIDFARLKTTGFGVYGYRGAYDSDSSLPTLFADDATNTHVTFVAGGTDPTTHLDIPGSWEYASTAGLKMWDADQPYTFFAYAPYMAEAGTAPGITSVKTGTTAGDPAIGYQVATDPAKSVDLLWGVRTDTEAKSGLPWIDVRQGDTHSAVLFTFCHALSAIGFHAQVMADQANDTDNLGDVSSLGTIGSVDGCKVTLKSVTLTPATTPFHREATLNLNNTTKFQPNWSDKTETIDRLTLDDGEIDAKLLDPAPGDFNAPNPQNYGVMTGEAYDTEVPGITETANAQPVIAGDNLFMLIPQAAQDYTVSIEYFLTYKTATGFHREAKTGSATISSLALEAGVKYYFNLVFGLTTFKVTVDAVDWEERTASNTIATETGTSASESLARVALVKSEE